MIPRRDREGTVGGQMRTRHDYHIARFGRMGIGMGNLSCVTECIDMWFSPCPGLADQGSRPVLEDTPTTRRENSFVADLSLRKNVKKS